MKFPLANDFQIRALLFEIYLHPYDPADASIVTAAGQQVSAFGTRGYYVADIVMEHQARRLDVGGRDDIKRSRRRIADELVESSGIVDFIRDPERLIVGAREDAPV